MRTNCSGFKVKMPMGQERRNRKRYKIDCPVTALTPGRGKKRTIGNGWLDDISDNGARFHLDNPLASGERISLEVHFSGPGGDLTDIRFPAVVKRVSHNVLYEIAVRFLKGESFIRRPSAQGKHLPRTQAGNGGRWIN